jgi:hypothetical protein
MLRGWIVAEEYEKKELESIGIIVGEYIKEQGLFDNCIVSEEAMNKLDPLWGVFYWGLKEV